MIASFNIVAKWLEKGRIIMRASRFMVADERAIRVSRGVLQVH
jgi:hypothetical protein